jgi:hypothetical protein
MEYAPSEKLIDTTTACTVLSASGSDADVADILHDFAMAVEEEARAVARGEMQGMHADAQLKSPSMSSTASTSACEDSGASSCNVAARGRSGASACSIRASFVVAAPESRVRDILSTGLGFQETRRRRTAAAKHVRLFSAPWGRSGLAASTGDVLVYVDVLQAMMSGADMRFETRGVVLASGAVISPHCIRRITRLADCEILFEAEED